VSNVVQTYPATESSRIRRRATGVALVVAAVILPMALSVSLWTSPVPTDRELAESAPEDILGFGFPMTWLVLTVPEGLLLACGLLMDNRRLTQRLAWSAMAWWGVFTVMGALHEAELRNRVLSGAASNKQLQQTRLAQAMEPRC
jgi:hypothetical protein